MDMQIINNLQECEKIKASSVALGTFDGLHLGHRTVISLAVGEGRRLDVPPMVIAVNRGYKNGKTGLRLLTDSQRNSILKNFGVQYLVNVDLEAIKDIPAEAFFDDIIIGKLRAKHIACGYNFNFGRGAKGDVLLLERLCKKARMDFSVASPVLYGNTPISSTGIRKAVINGNITAANGMMGRPFCFDFTVVGGDQLGRRLGAPTINQPFPDDFVLPRFGVYASAVEVDGAVYSAVTNIGVRPTIGNTGVRAESYILNFSQDLYGRNIAVSLLEFLRDEKKFESIEALKSAIKADAQHAAEIFEKRWKLG